MFFKFDLRGLNFFSDFQKKLQVSSIHKKAPYKKRARRNFEKAVKMNNPNAHHLKTISDTNMKFIGIINHIVESIVLNYGNRK